MLSEVWKRDLFCAWLTEDGQPDTFFRRDPRTAYEKCRLRTRRPPSRVNALEFEERHVGLPIAWCTAPGNVLAAPDAPEEGALYRTGRLPEIRGRPGQS